MGQGVGLIGETEFGVDPQENAKPSKGLLARLLRGDEVETIIFLRVTSRAIEPVATDINDQDDISALALGEASNELAGGGGDDVMLFSDGEWCGHADDFGSAHLEADPRLFPGGTASIRKLVPLFPEAERRAVQFIAVFDAANDDGFFNAWQYQRTVDAQRFDVMMGEEYGYSADWIPLARATGKSFSANAKIGEFELESIADALKGKLVCREKFLGRGAGTGDAHLAGQRIQIPFGYCPNVRMELEDAETGVYRASAGAINDFVRVKDQNQPLIWDGVDHPNYSSLIAAIVAPGYFTKANSIARCKLGSEARGIVTADIEGSTLFGQYSAYARDILQFIAQGPAGVPLALINQGSFGVLPDHPIGFLAEGDITAAEVFDKILRPWNGYIDQDAMAA